MAHAVTRIIHRCEDAQESKNLDLSGCQLMQVPDAVYHLMRHTDLKICNLSSNSIMKIAPMFANNFSFLTELNLSHNRISKLPDELIELAALENIDISHNAFISLPDPVYKMLRLLRLNASHNYIIEIDLEQLQSSPALEIVNLTENPLTNALRLSLKEIFNVKIVFNEADDEDVW